MGSVKKAKIGAVNKYKKQQTTDDVLLYVLTTLTCSLFCSSPFWYPPLRAATNVFLFVSLPKAGSVFFSSMSIFILGNLIVLFLVRESKTTYSSSAAGAADAYYDEHAKRSSRRCRDEEINGKEICPTRGFEIKGGFEERRRGEMEEEGEGNQVHLDAEELNKRADNFIAKINKQRRLEAMLQFHE